MANQRVKYPLTENAQNEARRLVKDWNDGKIHQFFTVRDATAGSAQTTEIMGGLGVGNGYNLPSLDILLELSKFQLLFVDYELLTTHHNSPDRMWHILLMQELRNAVANDFEVSDYFLTVNAVGTIITAQDGSRIEIRGSVQGAGFNEGEMAQQMSSSEIADKLFDSLDRSILQTNSELAAAIQDLKTSIESERQSKVGKVISQLGRSLEHGANTHTIIQGLIFLAQFLN